MPRLTLSAVLLMLLAVTAAASGFTEGLETFREATATSDPDEARERFRKAAEIWEAEFEAGTISTRLFTNIGNARAFAGDRGEAVLAYRRALLVDPSNDRARDALDAIRADLGIAARETSAGGSLLRALFFWHDSLTPGVRKILFGAAWIGGLALLVLARGRRRLRIGGAALLVVALALLVSLGVSEFDRGRAGDAVLIVRTEGRTGDGEFYSPSHTAPLPPGTELRILERRDHDGGWLHGELRDGTRTWLPAEAAARIVIDPVR